MTDKQTRSYVTLVQLFGWTCAFFAFTAAFYFIGGNSTASFWTTVKSTAKSFVLPLLVYMVNFSWLVPRLFFLNRKLQFLLLNAVMVLAAVLLPLLLSDVVAAFEESGLEHSIAGFSVGRFLIGAVLIHTLFYVCMINLAVGMRYVIRWYEVRKKLEEEQRRNSEAELNWLKNQLNPHFLFNTLNNISSLVKVDADKAQESICQLSELLRYALYESNCKKVRARDEVGFMRNYVDLMSLRCSPKTHIEVHFDDFDDSVMLSPLMFISLVENAFKHGTSAHLESFVRIDMGMDGDDIVFSCENSVIERETKDYSGSGVGLENMQRRLELLYPCSHTYEHSFDNGAYVVVVRIKDVKTDA